MPLALTKGIEMQGSEIADQARAMYRESEELQELG